MKIYELLDTPNKWTQGAYQRDSQGRICNAQAGGRGKPVAWCLVGAFQECYKEPSTQLDFFTQLNSACGGCVTVWNDAQGRTYQEVIDLCRQLDI